MGSVIIAAVLAAVVGFGTGWVCAMVRRLDGACGPDDDYEPYGDYPHIGERA